MPGQDNTATVEPVPPKRARRTAQAPGGRVSGQTRSARVTPRLTAGTTPARRTRSKPSAARRQRTGHPKATVPVPPAAGAEGKRPGANPPVPDHAARLRALVEKANAGDRAALADLRATLDAFRAISETCEDLGQVAERLWVDLLVGGDVLARESVRRRLKRLREDLAGPRPGALEALLAEEVGLCYLSTRHAEIAAASPGGASLALAAFRARRLELARRSLVRALKTLGTLRSLRPPGLLPPDRQRGEPEERGEP